MKVWILTGEFALSENGETFWLEGVYKTRRAGVEAAKLEAENGDHADRKVLVDGAMMGKGWSDEELEDENDMDWEVCYRLEEHEVMS